MREIRMSGSEGGGNETNRCSLPLSDTEGTVPPDRDGRDKPGHDPLSGQS
jgi:hypothetical protein